MSLPGELGNTHTHTQEVPRVHAQGGAQKNKAQLSGNLETDTVGLESLLQVVCLYKLYDVALKINAHLHKVTRRTLALNPV